MVLHFRHGERSCTAQLAELACLTDLAVKRGGSSEGAQGSRKAGACGMVYYPYYPLQGS